MTQKGFPKSERIVSRKLIDELFIGKNSHSLAAFPLRAVYINKVRTRENLPMEILVSVPKKRLKHAVDRNRVKRQVREAYRRQRDILCSQLDDTQSLSIAFIWLTDKLLPSSEVDRRMKNLMERMGKKLRDEV